MDTPNPLANRAAPVAEDLGPDLKPTGKSRAVWDGEEWTAERRGFDHYLAARGMGGMADTASSRMQAKQVREMEKALDAGQAGVNPNFKLTDALNGTQICSSFLCASSAQALWRFLFPDLCFFSTC